MVNWHELIGPQSLPNTVKRLCEVLKHWNCGPYCYYMIHEGIASGNFFA